MHVYREVDNEICSDKAYDQLSVDGTIGWTEIAILKVLSSKKNMLFPSNGLYMNKENLKYFPKIWLPFLFFCFPSFQGFPQKN